MLKLILVALSFLFGLLSIRRLRQFDVHEQEPFGKMVVVTAWGGLLSILLSLFLYNVLQEAGVCIKDGVPFSYFYVGFVEELAKLAALFLSWAFIRNELNEPTDGPIYIACVALGFSLIENYFYAAAAPNTTFLIALRLIICTPMHIAFSLFMGLAFFWAMRCRGGWGILLAAYVVAGIYHALYDIFVSYWYLLPGLYIILKLAYSGMYRLLGYTAANSPFRQSLTEFVSTTEPTVEEGMECLDCGNCAPRPTYRKGRIAVQRCESCGAYCCTRNTLHQLVHQYGSIFGRLNKREKPLSRGARHLRVLESGNRIDLKKRLACFQLDAFNQVLEAMTRTHAEQTEKKWWFPFRAERMEPNE